MPPGRPRKKAAKDTEFSVWWRGVVSQRPAANLRWLARHCGVNEDTARRWISGDSSPQSERAVIGWISAGLSAPDGPTPETPQSEWLGTEWQSTHAFTSMVEALRELEKTDPKSLAAWKCRVAWEAVLGAADVVRKVYGWQDKDWERIYRRKLDHWLRPKFGKRPEEQMIHDWLQVELALPEEE